jgi:hypothetical protein
MRISYGVIFKFNQERRHMRYFVLTNIVILLPLILIADGAAPNASFTTIKEKFSGLQTPEKPKHEHRINFGLLNLGYERILRESFYVGADVKFTPLYSLDRKKQNSFDHFVNGELRFGFNQPIFENDLFIPYFGVGFSVFKFEKKQGNLRDWNYATIGLKAFHKFGEIFEMGLHVKTYRSIQEKRTSIIKKRKPQNTTIIIINDKTKMQDKMGNKLVIKNGKLQPENSNAEVVAQQTFQEPEIITEKSGSKTISFKDASWMVEIGLPLIWHLGQERNWEIQVEPYYMQIPSGKRMHLLGSRLSFGFRF